MSKFLTLFFILFFSGNALAEQNSASKTTNKFNFDEDYQDNWQGNGEHLINDPFESFNRKIFNINESLDRYVAEPVAKEYRRKVPRPVRNSVRSFLNNLSAPLTVVNSLLQGNGHNAMASFSSFLINTTIGLGGIFDVAGNKNIGYNVEDLGQTLGYYGFSSGPYLVLPILGPSDLRDFSGLVVEKLSNPLTFNILKIGGKRELVHEEISLFIAMSAGIDTRENLIDVLDDMRANSFDTYATVRSAYLQKRQSLIDNQ